ncbi:histone-lysine N-methyltransferase SETMAR-like [Uloborus diversus]|uniref:histone-lysine N-methyltransferase SETMAR-like n=1 Tax=Uloborus diversus TaxID=327109 RepID=UPI002409453F|nr:histone-lysine N-methyltransferase SETMAR-like [Uloborus diversus]XP_054720000.1 histone-lysine N-methyltransferase SETMAR-like [Uloborus diversus]
MAMDMAKIQIYVEDISDGTESLKISFINDCDESKVSSLVKYKSCCTLSSESCAEDFESYPAPCACPNECESSCSCALGGNIAYNHGILAEKYLNPKTVPIIECSKFCTCNAACRSAVVQKGITYQLQVFKTPSKGFGVRTLEFIPKLAFVCEYAGEIIDVAELRERMKCRTSQEPNYVFVLKEHSSCNSVLTIIDPTFIGNVGRYLNHSCSPNLVPVPVRANSMVPRICFFAKEDIEPSQELTYNYAEQFDFNETMLNESQREVAVNKSNRKCYCGKSNCIGYLPLDTNWLI